MAEIIVLRAIYLYFMFLRRKLGRKYERAAIDRERVTKYLGTARNIEYNTIKNPLKR